jgi:hypothetical protein
MPNTRMSSYPCFPHFYGVGLLDNVIAGIPNAIMSRSAAVQCRSERVPAFAAIRNPD